MYFSYCQKKVVIIAFQGANLKKKKQIRSLTSSGTRNSTALVSRAEVSCGVVSGDLKSNLWRRCLMSLLASLTAACSLSSERAEKLMELPGLFMSSRPSDGGSGRRRSITMGAGRRTWLARFRALAGMASLNNSYVAKKIK